MVEHLGWKVAQGTCRLKAGEACVLVSAWKFGFTHKECINQSIGFHNCEDMPSLYMEVGNLNSDLHSYGIMLSPVELPI